MGASTLQPQRPEGMLPYGTKSGNMYGPQSVPQGMMDILNLRFGWNPEGVARGRELKNINSYYVPPQYLPNASVPPLV